MEHEVEPATQVAGNVTIVEGSTFCVSAYSGQINADEAQGLFFRDVRIVSGWRLLLDGRTTQPLMVLQEDPYRATFIARVSPQGSQTELLVERTRFVGEGMREDIRLRNLGQEPVTVRLSLDVAADFADVFAVKEHRVRPHGRTLSRCAMAAWTSGGRAGRGGGASSSPPREVWRRMTASRSTRTSARTASGRPASSYSRDPRTRRERGVSAGPAMAGVTACGAVACLAFGEPAPHHHRRPRAFRDVAAQPRRPGVPAADRP